VDNQTRFKQTIDTLQSLRKYVPDAIIVLAESSQGKELSHEELSEISKYSNVNLIFYGDADLMAVTQQGLKSQAELILLHKTLTVLKTNRDLMKMMSKVKRIYKFSGRTNLIDGFDINQYNDVNLFGKYVFKTRISSWMSPSQQQSSGADHLLITRMYSLCPSLIDNYMEVLMKNFNDCNTHNIDTEHTHYKNISKNYLVEFENLYCEGVLAGTGLTERY
jgi:hypothetical protein